MQSFFQYRQIGQYVRQHLPQPDFWPSDQKSEICCNNGEILLPLVIGKPLRALIKPELFNEPLRASLKLGESDLETIVEESEDSGLETIENLDSSTNLSSVKTLSVDEPGIAPFPSQCTSLSSSRTIQIQNTGDAFPFRSQDKETIPVYSEGSDDPTNPKSWSMASRYKNVAIMTLLVFVQGWAGAADSLADHAASEAYNVSQTIEDLATSLYCLGIGLGSLFSGPTSESLGRNPVFLVNTLLCFICVMGSAAATNISSQLVARFFVGFFASATLTINGTSVSDQFSPLHRSIIFPIIALANVIAPSVAPIAGGWIVQSTNITWHWTDWNTAILIGSVWLLAFFFLSETYQPLLMNWKARQLRLVTGDPRYLAACEKYERLYYRVTEALTRPVIFFSREPVVIVLGLYLILLYTIFFTFLQGFDFIFRKTYHWTNGETGSAFAAIATGALLSAITSPFFRIVEKRNIRIERHMSPDPERLRRDCRKLTLSPEVRLWPAMIASPLLAISLFWLCWTDFISISYFSPLAACLLFGYALMNIYIGSYQYIIDSYGVFAASALASITSVRYIVACGTVMGSRKMYSSEGIRVALIIIGALATLLVPAPWILWKFGVKIRAKSRYAQ